MFPSVAQFEVCDYVPQILTLPQGPCLVAHVRSIGPKDSMEARDTISLVQRVFKQSRQFHFNTCFLSLCVPSIAILYVLYEHAPLPHDTCCISVAAVELGL